MAAPAIGFAQCVPALAGALDLSVREALANRPTPTQQATIAARRHVGAARGLLRQALADRTARQPGGLAAQLPSHPRLAPPPRVIGPQR